MTQDDMMDFNNNNNEKGVQPIKAFSASKPSVMAIYINGEGYIPNYHVGTKYFGLSYENAQDMDDRRLKAIG